MKDMIYRYHYRGHFSYEGGLNLEERLEETKEHIKKLIKEQKVMTACLYRHENMLFAYYESMGEELSPEEVYGKLHDCLAKWPGEETPRDWVKMHHIYWHCIPEGVEDWRRPTRPELRRGRIAYLKPETMFSYVYHHVAITEEGLLVGDKYQSIGLHENILFSYFEEPKTEINIKRDSSKPSKAIEDWLAVDPGAHFILWENDQHFTFIETLIAMGENDEF